MTGKRTKPDNALGQQLRAKRRALGLSQREAATLIGISFPYLCQLEKGHTKSPTLSVCLDLAKAYDLTIEQIAEWTQSPPEERPLCPHCRQELEGEA